MALTKLEITFLAHALKQGLIPQNMHILELGESNLSPADAATNLLEILSPHIPSQRSVEAARRAAVAVSSRSNHQKCFGPARAIYYAIFDPASYTALDLELGPRRYCMDLNKPVSLQQQFDCVINNGTSEHIFDQANVFRVIHNHTRAGGIMIHYTPCLGWANHGLFHAQPGFFFDLAAANGYEIALIALCGHNAYFPLQSSNDFRVALRDYPNLGDWEMCALIRKVQDTPFSNPVQGLWIHHSPWLKLAGMPRRHERQARRNLALHRPATQSSTSYWSWHDDPALDAAGGNNGHVTGYFGFCTDSEDEPWWTVDLGAIVPITEIVVFNRLDGVEWACRAARLCISLSEDGQQWEVVFSRLEDSAFGGADGNPLRVEIRGHSARYVRVFLPGHGFLHLDEIEVY